MLPGDACAPRVVLAAEERNDVVEIEPFGRRRRKGRCRAILERIDCILEVFADRVNVALRLNDAPVAHELLYRPDVLPLSCERGPEEMPKRMDRTR